MDKYPNLKIQRARKGIINICAEEELSLGTAILLLKDMLKDFQEQYWSVVNTEQQSYQREMQQKEQVKD